MYPDAQNQPQGWASLEERYEVMKEIGDGSFGSVALARVRTAGAHIARRGTLVCPSITSMAVVSNPSSGRYQDDEEDIRLVPILLGASRSHLSSLSTPTSPSCPSAGHLLGSLQQTAPHCHGVHGWQSLPIDEGARSQAHGRPQCKEHPGPDLGRLGAHSPT